MNIKTRLNKLEAAVDPTVCPVCGHRLPTVTEARTKAEAFLVRYQKQGLASTEALARLSQHAPVLMRRAGMLSVIPAGHCTGCGKSLKSLQEIAQGFLARYTVALQGDEEAALTRLRDKAPALAAHL